MRRNNRLATQVPIDVGGERLAYVATSDDVPRGAYLSARDLCVEINQ